MPVEKDPAVVLDKEIPLGDRRNTAFMGTLVTYGRGKGLVTCTGMNTQIGLIAQMIQSFEDESTPLQKKLEHLGKVLGTACLAICAVVFVYGLFRDTHLADVANIGLLELSAGRAQGHHQPLHDGGEPGHRRGAGRAAGHRDHLPGAGHAADDQAPRADPQAPGRRDAGLRHRDLLGQDRHADAEPDDGRAGLGRRHGASRSPAKGYNPTGEFFLGEERFDPRANPDATALLQGAIACNDAKLEERPDESGRRAWSIIGDPTEGAMIVAAAKSGYLQDDFAKALPRVQEIPFDSERKRMTTIHRNDGMGASPSGFAYPPLVAIVKGAPDVVLELCGSMLDDGKVVALTHAMRDTILGPEPRHGERRAARARRGLPAARRDARRR